MNTESQKLDIGTILFEGYELLDTYGPLELFLLDSRLFNSVMLAEQAGKVKSSQGPIGIADQSLQECEKVDLLMIPGGFGTRKEVDNATLIKEISRLSQTAKYVCTICTGAALLAKTGLLDGLKATTNKAAWEWVTSQRSQVNWVAKARWVEDGKYFTSSGISAGMDMTLGLISHIYGKDTSMEIAKKAEYEWHQDRHWDPFAEMHGLV